MTESNIRRRPLHTRHITCLAYERDDGWIDIEGEMQDVTPDGTDLFFRQIDAGAFIHRMKITMTVDRELVIRSITAHIHDGATPNCHETESAYRALEGLKIGPGFRKQIQARVGGRLGCTHLTELLLGPMATTAVQSRFAMLRASPIWRERLYGNTEVQPPAILDTCHAYRVDGEAIKQVWPVHRRPGNGAPRSQ
ncbi:DUF2889 domain-containing protein [Paraburkholderia sp. Tr-20389]|uniref:DUF2889 domain-containing protein n=1 Tax=Paraburkholderia sp. Tr-20389 TaxID=2703903 RepID=UPI00197F340E|nr:DUF2889 domain-containing protein [Paraburkholderia sp. Tr-20389]MBN3755607.1 DUF2889 domain-containing protein [Paraburkholderia sp. Tr-20389]